MNTERRELLLGFLAALGLELPHQANPLSLEAQLAPLDEALTHTSAGLAIDHERLEFVYELGKHRAKERLPEVLALARTRLRDLLPRR